jgi:hypothetical protein
MENIGMTQYRSKNYGSSLQWTLTPSLHIYFLTQQSIIMRFFIHGLHQRFPNFYTLRHPLKCFLKLTPPSTRINSNKLIWHKAQLMYNTFLTFAGEKNAAYSSEPVPVLSDKYNISTEQVPIKIYIFSWVHYQYYISDKVFQPRKVAIIIYILSCLHISFKISMSLIQTTHASP